MAGESGRVWEVELERQLETQRAEFQRVVDEANATIKRLHKVIDEERERHAATQTELENLKKGSIAMMKYATNLQRKKHDMELETLKESLREARRSPGARGRNAVKEPGAEALDRRADELDAREKEIKEEFARMKEERELRRADVDSKFIAEMERLPEMQKVIVEEDAELKQLSAKLQEVESEARRLRVYEAVGRGKMVLSNGGRDLERQLQAWDDEIVGLRHELATRDLHIEELQRTYDAKMRNTMALQRIKYEEEIAELKRRARVARPRLGLRRR